MSGVGAAVGFRGLATLMLVLACGADHAPPAAEAPASGADSSTTVIGGPTLLSSFPITQAQIDSGGDANEAYADYQHYLGLAMPVLERYGVQVVATNDSALRWRDSLGAHELILADSIGIAYLLVTPNGKLFRLGSGVQADGAILDAARTHFALPIPTPVRDSVEP